MVYLNKRHGGFMDVLPPDFYAKLWVRAPTGFAVLQGEELRVILANPAVCAMLGLDREVEGELVETLLPQARLSTLEHIRSVIRSGRPSILHEFESPVLTTAEGAPTYWDLDCQPLDWDGDGAIDSVLLLIQDVTMHVSLRRQAERRAQEAEAARAQLAEREAMLQLALDAAAVGAWEYEFATGLMRYSASRSILYGLESEETVADVNVFLSRMHREDCEQLLNAFAEALQSRLDEVRHQFRVLRPDGARHVSMRARIIRDAAGAPLRAVGVDVDLTAEHAQQERLESFARTVAHDLRSPLRTISGFTELLARSARDRLEPSELDCLAYMQSGVQQLDALVEGVLAYASSADVELHQERVDLNAVLAEVVASLGAAIAEADAQIEQETLPVIMGHRVLLTQLLQNLLANAVKFRAERPLKVAIGAARGDGEWVVSIRDNGLGIPQEQQAALFTEFARADSSKSVPGLGLGLALAQKAAARHGGRVWVESTPGVGSTFFLALPEASTHEREHLLIEAEEGVV
jgi:PAS domain S-box-containing protein